MISGLVQILLFQSLGELISKFALPTLPGPVIGLVLLIIWLVARKGINPDLASVADGFSRYLGLLFVPAAVGVVLFLPQLKANALAIVSALVGSVIVTIATSAIVVRFLSAKPKRGRLMNEKHSIVEIWVYLSGSPLFALFITLAAYQIGLWIYKSTKQNPLANPVAIAIILVASVIQLIEMPYSTYFEGAQFIHFLLGSATVSLAIPIYRGLSSLKGRSLPLLASLLAGGLASIISAVNIAKLLGADSSITGAMYPKSVTAPIAMGIAERIGVSPTLTAIFAVTTGILGAILAPFILNALGMKAWWQRGFAIGIGAHGIGTSRAFSIHPEAGTYASLAMGMNGVISAVAIPILYHVFN